MFGQFPKSSVALLRAMEVGESRVLTERHSKNAGAPTSAAAVRAGVKVKTNKCLVVIPHTEKLMPAVLVTRTK